MKGSSDVSAGTSGSGAGHAGTQSTAGASGASGGGGGGAAGSSSNLDASTIDLDSAMQMPDLDASAVADAGDAGGSQNPAALATCDGWTPPGATACPAVCTGGCAQGVCRIACEGVVCVTALVACPQGFSCLVSCTSGNACTSAHVVCADGPCDVLCTGSTACTSMTVDCGADACRMSCIAGSGVGTGFNVGKSCAHDKSTCQ